MSGRGFLLSLFLIWNFTGLMSQTTEVVINLNNRDFLVSDHFQDITYIKLETSKECLLRYPANIVIDDGLIFIQDLEVYAFNLNGKFLNGFGRIGKGPGEYAMVIDFIVDSKKKNVEILSGTHINCYKYSGECKYRVKTAQVHRLKTAQLRDVKISFPSMNASSFLPGKGG